MKVSTYIFIGLILSLFESSLFSFIPAEFLKPDITIPFIIYTAFFLKPSASLIVTITMGIFQEILSSSPFGSLIFLKITVFLLALFFKNKLYIDSRYSFSYICAGAIVCESLIYILLSWIAKGELKYIENILFFMVPNAVFTGFIAMFVFSLIESINTKYFDRR